MEFEKDVIKTTTTKIIFSKSIKLRKGTPVSDFNKKLAELTTYVQSLNIKIYNGNEDGRVISQLNECKVIDPIIDKFSWVLPSTKLRDEGDFYIKTVGNFKFPVNVKLINENKSTTNNITGVVRVLSKLLYNKVMPNYNIIAKALREGVSFTKTPQAYGLLVVDKTTGITKSVNLLNIHSDSIVINPSNGFQFNSKNLRSGKRTQLQGQVFLANKFIELLRKRAEPFLTFKENDVIDE